MDVVEEKKATETVIDDPAIGNYIKCKKLYPGNN